MVWALALEYSPLPASEGRFPPLYGTWLRQCTLCKVRIARNAWVRKPHRMGSRLVDGRHAEINTIFWLFRHKRIASPLDTIPRLDVCKRDSTRSKLRCCTSTTRVLTVTSHARASAAPQPALTMTLGHAWPGGSLCYYKHANTTSFRLDAPSKCKSEQCRLDLLAFQQCPLSHRY